MERSAKHLLTVILGLLVAVGIMFSSITSSNCSSDIEKSKTEQTSDTETGSFAYISAATVAPSSALSLESNLLACCIFEIQKPEVEQPSFCVETFKYCEKLFVTLFTVIISPNAP